MVTLLQKVLQLSVCLSGVWSQFSVFPPNVLMICDASFYKYEGLSESVYELFFCHLFINVVVTFAFISFYNILTTNWSVKKFLAGPMLGNHIIII